MVTHQVLARESSTTKLHR